MKFMKKHLTSKELGRVFGLSEKMICRRLTEIGLRTLKGKPSCTAFLEKWVTSVHPKSSEDQYAWHSERTVAALVDDGLLPVVPPPTDLVVTPHLEGPFTTRANSNAPHEIVGSNGEVAVWVAGDANAQLVCRFMNAGHRLGVISRFQQKQPPRPDPFKVTATIETDGFVILGDE